MASVGTATLNVVPKIDGLPEAIRKAGEQAAPEFSSGMSAKSGVIIGAFSAITQKAMSAVNSSMDAAISRFDTLNNFPTVMQNLGYSAEQADSAISQISDRLSNLPTTLDQMVALTQGLVTVTGDLEKAKDVGLALNDMLVASGSSTQTMASAQNQFQQILAKGVPQMEDWRSLVTAMPGQMDQLAKSLLGPTANANDLYSALGGGGNEVTVTLDQLMDEMVRLDREGGESFASFQEQAETAAGGVATNIANMKNAITKGIASVMDEIGSDNISMVFTDIKGAINDAFKVIRDVTPTVLPALQGVFEVLKSFGPAILGGAGAAFAVRTFADVIGKTTQAILGLGTPLGATTAIFGALAAAVGVGVSIYGQYKTRVENAEKATVGLNEAVSRATLLDEYAGKIQGIGSAAESSAVPIHVLNESIANHVDKINEISDKAEEEIASLNTAQSVIQQYVGQTDLSTQAQGRLEYALKTVNEQFGLQLTQADVLSGTYTDQDGNVQNLVASIESLIDAKKREIQLDALSEQLGEAYAAQQESRIAYAEKLKEADEQREIALNNLRSGNISDNEYKEGLQKIDEEVQRFKDDLDSTNSAVNDLEKELGDTQRSATDAADAFDAWGEKMEMLPSLLKTFSTGTLPDLKDDLRDLGADTEELSKLSEDELKLLAKNYDGTAASLIGILDEFKIGMSNISDEVKNNVSSIQSTMDELKITEPLNDAEIDVDQFILKLSEANVSTETLKTLGTNNLLALASACKGNIASMVTAISDYNKVDLKDKDGNVTIDESTLIDAQGHIYTWNGTTLERLDGEAVVDDTSLVNAQGRVYTWNGSYLELLRGSANIDGDLEEKVNLKDDWNKNGLNSYTATAAITMDVATNTPGAVGPVKMAKGGLRYHADGFIAAKPTFISPTDVVGEAGAEAIIPLTNKHYVEPFAKTVADLMGESSKPTVINNYYWNNTRVEDGTRMNEAMQAVAREARMRERA